MRTADADAGVSGAQHCFFARWMLLSWPGLKEPGHMLTKLILAVSLVVNGFLLLPWLKVWPMMPIGGGQQDWSSDTNFVALAESMHCGTSLMESSKRDYYEFLLQRGMGQPPLKTVIVYPLEKNSPMYFRDLTNIVNWSSDSRTVTFTIPGMTLTIDTESHPWDPNSACLVK